MMRRGRVQRRHEPLVPHHRRVWRGRGKVARWIVWARSSRVVGPRVAIEGLRVWGIALPFHPISRQRGTGGRGGGQAMVRPNGGGFLPTLPPSLPPTLLPPLGTMAQQSVTRVTGRRSGCHHKTFQLVIANISVAAPAHARCRADSHARHVVLTRPSSTRARVPGTRTLLFPLSAGWKTTTMGGGAAQGEGVAREDGGDASLRIVMVQGFFLLLVL